MRYLLCGLLILGMTAIGFGQKAKPVPNFTGIWKLKEGSPQRAVNGLQPEFGQIVGINHADNEITIVGKGVVNGTAQTVTAKFFTDGRGEENPWLAEGKTVKSTTNWEGDKLTIILTLTLRPREMTKGSKESVWEFTVVWELSKDGKELIYEIKRNRYLGDPTARQDGPTLDSSLARNFKRVYVPDN